jgi:hypothetical protein
MAARETTFVIRHADDRINAVHGSDADAPATSVVGAACSVIMQTDDLSRA